MRWMRLWTLSNPSDVDGTEDTSSTCEPNWSDPCSPRLSNADYFSNSSDIVCISSDCSDEPPLPKKNLLIFFMPAKTRVPAFLNDIGQLLTYLL